MRRSLSTISLLCAIELASFSASRAQWSVVASANRHFEAVAFYDRHFGLAVGGGVIYKTEDGGTSWAVSDTTSFRDVSFYDVVIDSTTVGPVAIAAGSNLTVVRSADRGTTWRRVDLGSSSDLRSICYLGNGRFDAFGDGGWLGRSTDTGLSWQTSLFYPGPDVKAATCLPAGRMWVGGFVNDGGNGSCCHVLLRSDDLGATWSQAFKLSTVRPGDFVDIDFPSDTIGFAVNTETIFAHRSQLWKTTDGGDTWNIMGTFPEVRGMSFIDEHTGVMVGSDGLILWSEDGGETWAEHPSPVPVHLYDVTLLDARTALAVGDVFIVRNAAGASVAVEPPEVPSRDIKIAAFPNPARYGITISFETATSEPVRLTVRDVLGRVVNPAQAVTRSLQGGDVRMSVEDLPDGLYFYTLRAGAAATTGSFLKVK